MRRHHAGPWHTLARVGQQKVQPQPCSEDGDGSQSVGKRPHKEVGKEVKMETGKMGKTGMCLKIQIQKKSH